MASSNFLLLSLALLLAALSFIANFTTASLEEANALQKWKATLKIPNNTQIVSSWMPLPTNTSSPTPCPSWFGIACNADGNINMLNLSTSELKGTLRGFPFSILRNLTHFELSVNSFFGPIPPEIGLLSKLVYLDFSNNRFSGVIPPTIGKLSQSPILSWRRWEQSSSSQSIKARQKWQIDVLTKENENLKRELEFFRTEFSEFFHKTRSSEMKGFKELQVAASKSNLIMSLRNSLTDNLKHLSPILSRRWWEQSSSLQSIKERQKWQIDILTKENENLKRELEFFHTEFSKFFHKVQGRAALNC
ncbi:leucine-rich repeat receptor-like protein kinase family protein [Artemisia annua]|uniref:Leucine-rich repeat receptor-like protein kinase family protein n=1 Tax=Artemisia annua TaxID=35608 RepID=A0A2U1N2C6_ARTAN|nr:leucine-rich repeat receptor-like protein kinase family protein [Artemisia annua]